eukprot:Blabericola_migrator_1__5417@NODE_2772_length_2370_cov_181_867564_g1736_i0_p2_GENE_NODE_2772_length_2370_cov_181_867564_g1736_i0NODE_2772_length_2370_cov_181_867564_g1736_i0_p2_ORF_typecomplete_len222_score47_55_NODE_2772_length_2370_cov_181_867564_g1736_i0138803
MVMKLRDRSTIKRPVTDVAGATDEIRNVLRRISGFDLDVDENSESDEDFHQPSDDEEASEEGSEDYEEVDDAGQSVPQSAELPDSVETPGSHPVRRRQRPVRSEEPRSSATEDVSGSEKTPDAVSEGGVKKLESPKSEKLESPKSEGPPESAERRSSPVFHTCESEQPATQPPLSTEGADDDPTPTQGPVEDRSFPSSEAALKSDCQSDTAETSAGVSEVV